MELSASVGLNGINCKSDVELVQEALNRAMPHALLTVDGVAGALTNEAIARFQRMVLKFTHPDSLVEKGGRTWTALSVYLTESQPDPDARVKTSTSTATPTAANATTQKKIAWGARVSSAFKVKVIEVCAELNVNVDYLMACMAFETGETFSPSIKNAAGSGATGLIQFMPATARALGTSTEELGKLTAVGQLDYVKKYFQPYKSRLRKLEDVYMAILYPAAIGKPTDHALFKEGRQTYAQNKGFDANQDGIITLNEISSKVRAKYEKGLTAGYIG